MDTTTPTEEKETAPEYLNRAFSSRPGRWLTMEEIKIESFTNYGVRTLCSRGAEAVKSGRMINRFRAGKEYKEWSWLGSNKPEFFFFGLQGQFSPVYDNYSDVDSHVKKLLYTSRDTVEIYRGSHEQPVLMTTLRLSPQDLLDRGYAICPECHGKGNLVPGITRDVCIFCSGTGWNKQAVAK